MWEPAVARTGLGPGISNRPAPGFIRRQVRRHLITMSLVVLLLPLVFLDQDIASDPPLAWFTLTPQQLPPLTPDEAAANAAVLEFRACPAGPSLGELIDAALLFGRVGMIHGRAGSRVRQSATDPAIYAVDVVTETLTSGVFGPPSRSESTIGFSYNTRTGKVTGRDTSGRNYLASARWECARELSPWRRGPPQPFDSE